MVAESVTKNTTYLTLSYIGQKILSFFYFVAVARFVGVEDLGKYTFAISFTTLFSVFIDLGLTNALVREAAKFRERSEKYLSTVLGVKLVFSLVVYCLVALFINLLGYPEITRHLVYLSGITMICDQFTTSFWGVYRGHQNLKIESVNVLINQAIIVIVGLIVLFMRLPLVYLMLPFISASVFSMLFAGWSVRRRLQVKFFPQLDSELLKTLLRISIPFALVAIFSRVYGHIDSIMLSKLAGDKAVGWYSVAMKIPVALQFIPAALAAAVFPAFSRHFTSDKAQLKQTFDRVMRFLTIAVLPISLGVAVLARPLILLFYGESYLPAAAPLQILMLALFFIFLNFPLGSLLNGCDRQVANTVLVGSTMVFNIVLNIFLIPKYSSVGAAAAFLASHSLLFIMSMLVARKIVPYGRISLLITLFKTMISAAFMAALLYYFVGAVSALILIPSGALIYFCLIFLLRGLTISDLKYFYHSFFKKKEAEQAV